MILVSGLIFVIILVNQIKKVIKDNKYFYIFIISFFLKIILLLLSENNMIALVDGGNDTLGFLRESIRIYNTNNFYEILTKKLSGEYGTYPVFLSILYNILYPSHLVMLFINILLHNSIILMMIKILEYLSLSRIKKTSLIILVAIFPIAISYSVILLREIIYIWFVTYICYQIFYYKHYKKIPNNIFLTITISFFAFILHPANFIIPIAAFLLFFKLNKFLKYSFLGIFIIISYLYTNGQLSSGYVNSYSSKSTDIVLEKINFGRESSSAFYEKHYTSSVLNNIFYAFPIDFANFYFRPFVLPLSNAYARLQRYPYGLMSLFLFYLLIKKFKYMNSFEKKLLWLLILGMLPFVIGSGDLFQAVRHRMNFFTLNVILIGILLQNKRFKKLDDVR